MNLHGTTALVTGATGFIGGRLAERLILEEGVKVRALARDPSKGESLASLGAEIIMGDVTQPSTFSPAIEACELVFHVAARTTEYGTRQQFWAANVAGTENVLHAAHAAGVQRFVHVSTVGVYGEIHVLNIDEATPLRERGDLYADSKIEAERAAWRAYRESGLPVVVARPAQVYGPGSKQYAVRPVQVIQAGKMLLVDGGRFLCNPVYIDNLVEGLVLCAKVDAAVGEAFNLSDGFAIPWRDFFGAYGHMVGVEHIRSLPFPLAWSLALLFEAQASLRGKKPGLSRRTLGHLRHHKSFSIAKAERILGWTPRIGFEEGIRRTEAWLRAQGYLS